jgi:hypothetical protein
VRRAVVPFRDVFERGRERVCEEREFVEREFAEREVAARELPEREFAERVFAEREVELDAPLRDVRVFAWAIVTASLWSGPVCSRYPRHRAVIVRVLAGSLIAPGPTPTLTSPKVCAELVHPARSG